MSFRSRKQPRRVSADDWPFLDDPPPPPAWVDSPLGRLEYAAIIVLPLTVTAVIGAGLTHAMIEVGHWPLWLAALVGFPVAFAVVVGFCFTMGHDGHDFIVGSLILIVLAALAFPTLKRGRQARLVRERQRLEQRLPAGANPSAGGSPVRRPVPQDRRDSAR